MFNTTKCLCVITFFIFSVVPISCLGSWKTMSTPVKHGLVATGIGAAGVASSIAAQHFKLCTKRYISLMNMCASLALLYATSAYCVDSYQMDAKKRNWAKTYLMPGLFIGTVIFAVMDIRNAYLCHNSGL